MVSDTRHPCAKHSSSFPVPLAINRVVLENGVSEPDAKPSSKVVATSHHPLDPSSSLPLLPLAVKPRLLPEPSNSRSVPTPITRNRQRCRTRSSRSHTSLMPPATVLPSVLRTMDRVEVPIPALMLRTISPRLERPATLLLDTIISRCTLTPTRCKVGPIISSSNNTLIIKVQARPTSRTIRRS
jgi:hypothetical protein